MIHRASRFHSNSRLQGFTIGKKSREHLPFTPLGKQLQTQRKSAVIFFDVYLSVKVKMSQHSQHSRPWTNAEENMQNRRRSAQSRYRGATGRLRCDGWDTKHALLHLRKTPLLRNDLFSSSKGKKIVNKEPNKLPLGTSCRPLWTAAFPQKHTAETCNPQQDVNTLRSTPQTPLTH